MPTFLKKTCILIYLFSGGLAFAGGPSSEGLGIRSNSHSRLASQPTDMVNLIYSYLSPESLFSASTACSDLKGPAVKLLKKRAGEILKSYEGHGRAAVLEAVRKKDLTGLKLLIKAGADVNVHENGLADATPLHIAIRNRDEKAARVLIEAHADVNESDSDYYNPKTPAELAAESGNLELVELVFNAGARMTCRDSLEERESCSRLLTLASQDSEHAERLVEILIHAGASPNQLLHLAAQNRNMNPQVLGILLRQGAGIQSSPNRPNPPLETAVYYGNIGTTLFLLQEHAGVTPRALLGSFKSPSKDIDHEKDRLLLLQTLLAFGGYVDSADENGSTLLHFAALRGDVRATEFLISSGADVRNQDTEGASALHKAIFGGSLDIIRKLVESGADVRSRDNQGRKPIDILRASKNYTSEIIWGMELRKYFNPYPAHNYDTRTRPPYSDEKYEEVLSYLESKESSLESPTYFFDYSA